MANPVAANLVLLNKYINCFDIGKDAKEPWNDGGRRVLDNNVHGAFIKNSIIAPLFNPAAAQRLPPADWGQVVGVGDRKNRLKERIEANIGAYGERPKQQLPKLKCSANDQDSRFDGINVAYDSGSGADSFFKSYRLVLSPGGVLDPGSRAKEHDPMIDGLEGQQTFNQAKLDELGLGHYLTQIVFNREGEELVFTFSFSPTAQQQGQPPQQEFRFDAGTYRSIPVVAGQQDYFAGNPSKNRFISENFQNAAELISMTNYILCKELGDTLQVAWLKLLVEVMGNAGFNLANTAIITCDSVVWLRSLVNNVGCIFKEGNIITFYPSNFGDNAQVFRTLMRDRLISKLNENNQRIIETFEEIRDDIAAIHLFGERIQARPVDKQIIIANVCNFLVNELTARNGVINAFLGPQPVADDGAMDAFRTAITQFMYKSPFVKKGDKYSNVSGFKSFYTGTIPGAGANKFDPMLFFKIMKTNVSNELIRAYLRDFNPPEAPPRVFNPVHGGKRKKAYKLKGGVRDGLYNTDREQMNKLWAANGASEGFVSYWIMNYYPELLYIGWSVQKALHEYGLAVVPDNSLFRYDVGAFLTGLFSGPNARDSDIMDSNLEAGNVANLRELEGLVINFCVLARLVLIDIDIFDYIDQDAVDFSDIIFQAFNGLQILSDRYKIENPLPALYNIDDNPNSICYRILDIYQQIYEQELDLTIRNIRNRYFPFEIKGGERTVEAFKRNVLDIFRGQEQRLFYYVNNKLKEYIDTKPPAMHAGEAIQARLTALGITKNIGPKLYTIYSAPKDLSKMNDEYHKDILPIIKNFVVPPITDVDLIRVAAAAAGGAQKSYKKTRRAKKNKKQQKRRVKTRKAL